MPIYNPISTPIKLVSNAGDPKVLLIFKDVRNEEVIDFSLHAGITCHMLIRKRSRGTCDDSTTKVDGAFDSDGTDGKYSFDMTTFLLTAEEGDYEAEINFIESAVTRKLYHLVNFRVREGLVE